jgi:riboflavin biosynthesis pyrimidine reductase
MLRLFPTYGECAVDDAYDDLDLGTRAPAGRPYMIVNMVATVDGQARIGDDTARLGGVVDQQLFIKLREQVDCVMAGPRTVEVEQYKGPASKPETRALRERRGLRPRPLFATASRSGVLPWPAPLFQDPGIEVVVFSEAELAAGETRASITQVRESDPAAMLRELRERFAVSSVLLEGGPRINGMFIAAGLVDELFLTVAPLLTGGEDPFPIIAGPLPSAVNLSLISVLLDESHLFLRYRVG